MLPLDRQVVAAQGREGCAVALDDAAAQDVHLLQAVQLLQPDGRGDVGHVVLEAGHHHVVAPAPLATVPFPGVAVHAVQAGDHAFFHQFGTAGEHAALGRGQVLGGVEGKGRRVRSRTDEDPLVLRRNGVGGVLDQHQVVLGADLTQRVQVAGVAAVVDGDDSPCPFAHRPAHLLRIDVQGVTLDVGQDRLGPGVFDHADCGTEGHRRGDDLVARPDTGADQRRVQGRRARVQGQCGRRSHVAGELLFEELGLRPGGDPAGPQAVDHGIDLGLIDVGGRERQKLFSHRAYHLGNRVLSHLWSSGHLSVS